jgi:hypothetical protein
VLEGVWSYYSGLWIVFVWLSTGSIWGSFWAETVSKGKLSNPHANASSKSTPSSSLRPCLPIKTVYAIRVHPISLHALCLKKKKKKKKKMMMMMMMMMIIIIIIMEHSQFLYQFALGSNMLCVLTFEHPKSLISLIVRDQGSYQWNLWTVIYSDWVTYVSITRSICSAFWCKLHINIYYIHILHNNHCHPVT